jgi:hypothetical protein
MSSSSVDASLVAYKQCGEQKEAETEKKKEKKEKES